MGRKKTPYEGGAWSLGGVCSARPKPSPAERRAALVQHFIPFALKRIAEGNAQYVRLLAEYRRELLAVSVELAKERAAARRAVETMRKAA